MAVSKSAAITALLLAGGAAAFLGLRKRSSSTTTRTPSTPSGARTVSIEFSSGGESMMKLKESDVIVVTYDPTAPWRYVAAPSDVIELLSDDEPGEIRLVVTKTMPTGGVSQAYVQALDENGGVLGEHKITVEGP